MRVCIHFAQVDDWHSKYRKAVSRPLEAFLKLWNCGNKSTLKNFPSANRRWSKSFLTLQNYKWRRMGCCNVCWIPNFLSITDTVIVSGRICTRFKSCLKIIFSWSVQKWPLIIKSKWIWVFCNCKSPHSLDHVIPSLVSLEQPDLLPPSSRIFTFLTIKYFPSCCEIPTRYRDLSIMPDKINSFKPVNEFSLMTCAVDGLLNLVIRLSEK